MAATVKSIDQAADVARYVRGLGARARSAARDLARSDTASRNRALTATAEAIRASRAALLAANRQDLDAGRGRLASALADRLELTEARIEAMAVGLEEIAALPDPIGEVTGVGYRPSGIQVGRMRVPLGVVGIIYESRPNVTADAGGLCLKAGNAVILRGGSEALHSNRAIAASLRAGLTEAALPADAIQVVETTDRRAVGELLRLDEFVDIIVPRGGKGLIERVMAESRIGSRSSNTWTGSATSSSTSGRTRTRPSGWPTTPRRSATAPAARWETLLVDRAIAPEVLPPLAARYLEAEWSSGAARPPGASSTAARSDARGLGHGVPGPDPLDPGGGRPRRGHRPHRHARLRPYRRHRHRGLFAGPALPPRVDSSSVMVNASTRFADGFEYGLGAEIGISTDKLHARGPVGLEGLTSQKFIVLGDGHIRQ